MLSFLCSKAKMSFWKGKVGDYIKITHSRNEATLGKKWKIEKI